MHEWSLRFPNEYFGGDGDGGLEKGFSTKPATRCRWTHDDTMEHMLTYLLAIHEAENLTKCFASRPVQLFPSGLSKGDKDNLRKRATYFSYSYIEDCLYFVKVCSYDYCCGRYV